MIFPRSIIVLNRRGVVAGFLLAMMIGLANGETVRFKEPGGGRYEISSVSASGVDDDAWLAARNVETGEGLAFGRRVAVKVTGPECVGALVEQSGLKIVREITDRVFLLEAKNARAAVDAAAGLAKLDCVEGYQPVWRREGLTANDRYARMPDDPFFSEQSYLENRDAEGRRAGIDLNVRAAWSEARGEGVVIGVVDDGIDLSHLDLVEATSGRMHADFTGEIVSTSDVPLNETHGTAVAGLAAARGDNGIGMSGVAPEASLTAMVIFDDDNNIAANSEMLMEAFRYRSQEIGVQNHSWGTSMASPIRPSILEAQGLEEAFMLGRGGLGTIMVRSAGNNRQPNPVIGHPGLGDANDDAFVSDPQAIAVAAVGRTGRAALYSSQGACLLVSAPSGDRSGEVLTPNIFATDFAGEAGVNGTIDPIDYRFDTETRPMGFTGTSASAPQIAGLAALLLSANPSLGCRDVQQILALSSRQFDPRDPGRSTNGAGFSVSHNTGFGVPDAGEAVRLAKGWTNKGLLVRKSYVSEEVKPIVDDGYRFEITADSLDEPLSIRCVPSTGAHQDDEMDFLPMTDVGLSNEPIGADLSGRGALVFRGDNGFREKIDLAADAGAEFAIVANNTGENQICLAAHFCPMGKTSFAPIPAVMIGETDGIAVAELLENDPSALGRLHLKKTTYQFEVTDELVAEHIGLRVTVDHRMRGHMRVALVSPAGTRSVMQHYNLDVSASLIDWTYWSTQHFFESPVGTWTVEFSDEVEGLEGMVERVELIVTGTAISDGDRDGLDDDWEMTHLGGIDSGATDDPDADGSWNAREQAVGTHPNQLIGSVELFLDPLDDDHARLSWNGVEGRRYFVEIGDQIGEDGELIEVEGRFPETEWILPLSGNATRFIRLLTE